MRLGGEEGGDGVRSTTPFLRGYAGSEDRDHVGILGDPYLQQVPLPRIPNDRKPNLGSEQLPWTPNYCVANTAISKPSQPAFLNGTTPFSMARHQQRIRILQSLTNIMTQ